MLDQPHAGWRDFSTARDNDDSADSKNTTAYAFGLRHTF